MDARIGDPPEPTRHGRIRGVMVRHDTGLLHAGGKWHPETALHIADEALHLTLRLGAVRPAQPRQEASMAGIVEQAGMETVPAGTIGVALQDHRLHVVEQHLARHAAKGRKCMLVAADERLDPFVGAKLHIGRPAPAQRGDEHGQPVATAPNRCPVRLHLPAWLGLEAHHRIGWRHRPQATHEILYPRLAARIAPIPKLAKQNHRRHHIRCRRCNPLAHIILNGSSFSTRFADGWRVAAAATQIAPHRVPRPARRPCNCTDAAPMLGQN